jgi:uncharacterized repeat protein (TIGR02543 family)
MLTIITTLGLISCTGNAKITISFNSNGGNEIEDIEFNTSQTSLNLPEPIRSGYTFEGWYLDEGLTQPFTIGALLTNQTITLYAKWSESLVTYTITFNSHGGSVVNAITLAAGDAVSAPMEPTREGYTFGGWYLDEGLTNAYAFSTMPAENITLHAKWNAVVVQASISFETNGGSIIPTITQNVGSAVSSPIEPTKEGHTFGGWYSDIALTTAYTFTTMPSQSITLYAKWTINTYTITFNANEGSTVAPITQNFNTAVTAPTDPTREGYTFDGWYANQELTTAYTFSAMPSQNIILYAKWNVNYYTITFEENGGSEIADITQSFGSTLVAPADPIKEGHNIGGWYTDPEFTTRFQFSNMPAENITLYARWNINNYTITFEENGGSEIADITQGFGSTVIAPSNPTRNGYTFEGWYANEDFSNLYTFTTMPSQNVTLYAAWAANPYTIDFEENGGNDITALNLNFGDAITMPEVSERIGYVFEGWYLDIELTQPFNLIHMPSHNIILYAKWVTTVDIYQAIDLQYAIDFAQSIITFALEAGQYTVQHPIKLALFHYQNVINDAENVDQVIEQLNQMIIDLSILILDEPTPVELINGIRYAMKSALGQAYTDFTVIAQNMGGYPILPTYLNGIYEQLDLAVNPQTAVPIMTKITLDSIIYMFMTLDSLATEYAIEHIEILYNMYKNTVDASELLILEAKYAEALLILDAIKLHENITDVYEAFVTYIQSLPGDLLTLYKTYVINEINILISEYDTHPNSSEISSLGNTYVALVEDAITTEFIDGLLIQFIIDLDILVNDVVYIHFETNGGTFIESIDGIVGNPVDAPTPPTKDQYAFDGWYTDETYLTAYVFSTFPNTSITLYAKWISDPTNNSFESAIEVFNEAIIYTTITYEDRVLYYKFTPVTSGLYYMSSQGGYDTYISLYNGSYVLLQSNDDSGTDYNFGLLYELTGGMTYYLKVNLYNENFPGDFSWTIISSDYLGNTNFDLAITIYEGQTNNASIIEEEGRIFFKFIPETTGYYKIESSSVHNLYIELYDDVYHMIGYQYTQYYYGSISSIKLYSGEVYYIAVLYHDESVTGNLDFGIHYQGDTNTNITNATLISSAVTTHEISLEARKVKYIQLTVDEMGHFNLSWQCDFSVFIELYDENFHRLTNSYMERTSFNFYSDEATVFYIVIIPSTYGDYGSIELKIANIDPENIDVDHAELLTYNGLTEILFYDANSSLLYYYFIAQETGWHQIYSSGDYDTYIELFDENFVYLAYDDDGGQDYNFNLKYYFEAGQKYYVVLDFYGGSLIKDFDVSMIYSTNENINFSSAMNMYNGETVYGSLMLFNEKLYYRFVPNASGYYQMTTSIDENILISIFDSEEKFIGYYYSQVYYYNLGLIHFVAGQTYFVRVRAANYEIFDFDFQLYHYSYTNARLVNAQQIYAEEITDVWVVTQEDSTIPYYKFIPEITGYYIIEDISDDMLAIEIYDINGHYLNRNNYEEHLYSVYLYQDQVYYINVLTFYIGEDGYTTDFNSEIMIKYVDYENIDIDYAKPIQNGDVVHVTILNEEDSLYYQFIPSESGYYNIFSMGNIYTSLIIYDANFEYLTQHDHSLDNNNFNLEHYFEMGVTYYLSVQMESDYIGRFDISIYHGETLNTNIDNAITVEVDQEISATIVANGAVLYFEFVPTYTGYYNICLEGSSYATLEIFDEEGHVVSDIYEDYLYDCFNYMFYFQKDKTYIITVRFYEDYFGMLSFIITLFENVEDVFINATEVYSEVTINTTVTSEEKVVYYKFIPTVSGYHYVSSQGDRDTYITLYDANYAILKLDDDGGSGCNFGLLYYFESGTTYYMKVNLYYEFFPGSFSWTIIPGNDFVSTLTFITNGGTEIEPISDIYDSYIENPVTIREGYMFDGWYLDGGYVEYYAHYLYSMPAGSYTLYAKWSINTYYIGFYTNGGTWIEDIYEAYGATFENPVTTMEGYTFMGWYEDYELTVFYGTEVTSVPARNLYLYAKWSINQFEIGYEIVTNDYDSILSIPLNLNETFIASVISHASIALTSENRVFTWGYNIHGTLGDGTTTTRIKPEEITDRFNLQSGEFIISVDLGSTHASALTSEGRVFMWGYNAYGQLGDGTTTNRNTPIDITAQFNLSEGETIIYLSLGVLTSEAISSSGRVFTWGKNEFGQLGDGTTTNRLTPTEITSQFGLNIGETVTCISSGDHSSSALTSDNRVFMWGKNDYGQLGDGTTANKLTPMDITSQFALYAEESIILIRVGDRHSAALSSEGRVFMWGYNAYGQLGDGTLTHRYIPTEITNNFNLVEGERVQSISVSSMFNASALTSEGRVFMWGYNGFGQLGDSTTTHRYNPTEITGNFNLIQGEMISSMTLGGVASSAISSNGRIFAWGQNMSGQLGDRTTTNRYTPVWTCFYYSTLTHIDIYDYATQTAEYVITKEGYTFTGWYTDRDLTEGYVFTYMPANNFILYGSWVIIDYEITYILDDGTNNVNNPTTYTIEDAFEFVEPTKDGYTFMGWYDNPEFLGDAITVIQQGTFGNMTLYAKWSS